MNNETKQKFMNYEIDFDKIEKINKITYNIMYYKTLLDNFNFDMRTNLSKNEFNKIDQIIKDYFNKFINEIK